MLRRSIGAERHAAVDLHLRQTRLAGPRARKRLPAQQAFPDLGIGRRPFLDVCVHCDVSLGGSPLARAERRSATRLIDWEQSSKQAFGEHRRICCSLDGERRLDYQARKPRREHHQRGSLKGNRMMIPATKNRRIAPSAGAPSTTANAAAVTLWLHWTAPSFGLSATARVK
jgi:hypothetical protein